LGGINYRQNNDDEKCSCIYCKVNDHTTESCGIFKYLTVTVQVDALKKKRVTKCSAFIVEEQAPKLLNTAVAKDISRDAIKSPMEAETITE